MSDDHNEGPSPVGIALSGGGTRAAMMGLGSIRRLYELGILRRATTISSVSGGCIVNAVLALKWEELMAVDGVDLELFDQLIAGPVRHICQTNLGMHVLGHKMNPTRFLERAKRKIKGELGFTPTQLGLLLAKKIPCMNKKLSELPKPRFSLRGGVPRFVFCGCDLNTGKPFYFTQEVVGHCLTPNAHCKHRSDSYPIVSEALTDVIPLCQAVGASAAVPLVFEPLTIKIEISGKEHIVGVVDGAVYDNLGLDPLIGEDNSVMLEGCMRNHQVVFVNDAGAAWFSPLERFSGKSTVRRVMRSLTIALSRGHDERVRFMDLMYKRHLLYGAYWRLADLEKIYDKFSEEEIEELQELCFPSKQVFDPLLISKLIDFRTDLNELKPAELRVLENAGYILAAFKFHRYVSPLLRDKNLLDTQYFSAQFQLPAPHHSSIDQDVTKDISELIDALKHSSSLVKSNLSLRNIPHSRKKKKKSRYECHFQFAPGHSASTPHLPTLSPDNLYSGQNEEGENEEGEEREEEGEEGDISSQFNHYMNQRFENDADRDNEQDDASSTSTGEEEDHEQCCYHNYPHDPNHPLYNSGKANSPMQ